jgi:hypothetical protein
MDAINLNTQKDNFKSHEGEISSENIDWIELALEYV